MNDCCFLPLLSHCARSHAPRSCLQHHSSSFILKLTASVYIKLGRFSLLLPSFFFLYSLYTMAFQTSMYITLFYTTVITQLAFLRSLANDTAATKWSMPRATKRRISEEDDNMIAYDVKNKYKYCIH